MHHYCLHFYSYSIVITLCNRVWFLKFILGFTFWVKKLNDDFALKLSFNIRNYNADISGIHYILFKDVIKIDNEILEHNCPVQKSSAVQQNLIMILRATKTYTNGFKELFTSTYQSNVQTTMQNLMEFFAWTVNGTFISIIYRIVLICFKNQIPIIEWGHIST